MAGKPAIAINDRKSGFGRVSFKSGDTVSVRALLFNTMTTLTMVAEKVVSRSMSSGTADQLPIGRCLSAPKNEESKQARGRTRKNFVKTLLPVVFLL